MLKTYKEVLLMPVELLSEREVLKHIRREMIKHGAFESSNNANRALLKQLINSDL